jgi:hypothetical protein
MAFPITQRGLIGFLCLVLSMSACQSSSKSIPTVVPATEGIELPVAWQTYTNTNYKFSIEYPPHWQLREISALENSTRQDEVWFSAEDFPPPIRMPGLT